MADADKKAKSKNTENQSPDKTVPAISSGDSVGEPKRKSPPPPPTIPMNPAAVPKPARGSSGAKANLDKTVSDPSTAATVPKAPPPPPKPGSKKASTAGNLDKTIQDPPPKSANDSTRGNFARTIKGPPGKSAKDSTKGNFDRTIQEPAPKTGKDSTKGDYRMTIVDAARSGNLEQTIQDNWGRTIVDVSNVSMSLKSEGQGVRSPTASVSVKQRVVTTVDEKEVDRATAGRPSSADYELIKILGEGGMGVVYTARQTSVDRTIAVKMIKGEAAQQTTSRNKFLAEAAVTADLDHPNIVPVYDLGTNAEGAIFYAMKKVKGKAWCDVIQDKDMGENLEILLRVCDAIAFAHDKGVVHRDLKPENVMLGDYGESLVMDWGLAGAVSESAKADRITDSNACCGTPCYMAPEMALGLANRIGTHSDIYLLGAILYEIVTGHAPHGGEDVMSCLMNAGTNEIIETPIKGELLDIAMKAMATEPEDRYGSVLEFQKAIRLYQEHFESTTLSNKAREGMEQAQKTGEYSDYAKALYGFQEALALWGGNEDARAGEIEARLLYAQAAMENEDFAQAEALLLKDEPSHAKLIQEVARAIKEQQARQRRMKRQSFIIKLGVAAIVVIICGALVLITMAMRKAQKERDAATQAKQAADDANKAAQAAKKDAERNAEAARASAERARQEQEKAEKAKAEAEAKRREAEEQRLKAEKALAAQRKAEADRRQAEAARKATQAKIQYEIDTQKNTWWVRPEADVKAAQQQAATSLGKPVKFSISLPRGQKVEFMLIPAGEFGMGSGFNENDRQGEEYLHRVGITKPFYMSRFELTRGQWQAITGNLPVMDDAQKTKYLTADHPVMFVSWTEVKTRLLPALQKLAPAGYRVRLPSEAEWEYACRAGRNTAFNLGDDVKVMQRAGWYNLNSNDQLHPVGKKAPNAWGLHDMHGNVGEFCEDAYSKDYYRRELSRIINDPLNLPTTKKAGLHRVYRGGGMINTAAMCRSAYRSWVHVDNKHKNLGVRLVLEIK